MADPAPSKDPAPKYLWITNNADTTFGLALKPKFNEPSKTMSPGTVVNLSPGATVIERALWDQWKKEDPEEAKRLLSDKIPVDPHRMRRQERAGMVFVVEGPGVKDKNRPFEGIDTDKARAIVPEIRDDRFLRQIVRSVTDGAVREAINTEIDRFDKAMRQPLPA